VAGKFIQLVVIMAAAAYIVNKVFSMLKRGWVFCRSEIITRKRVMCSTTVGGNYAQEGNEYQPLCFLYLQ
jgi:hypothetical protein